MTSTTIPKPRLQDISGRVIDPNDADYDAARTVFRGGVDKRPALIVRVADAQDVARVIALARETGLELAVRSGGHSSAGHSVTEGGIVLDLSDMKGLEIDVANRTAWAETGLTAVEVTKALAPHGLAVGFGDTGSVGIGGITTGGGIGLLTRKFGMTIDSLLAADVVTADGQLVRADERSHPDLFWALRGGGGNFGVATRFQYRLHEVPQVLGWMLVQPATAETIAAFIAEADKAPEELTTIANIMQCPPLPFVAEEHHGKLVNFAFVVYAGDTAAGERALAPIRAIAPAIADLIKPIPLPEIYPPEEAEYHPLAADRTMFLERVDRGVAKTIIDRTDEHVRATGAQMAGAQLRVLGGAMARVPADATAFALRSSRIMVNLFSMYATPAERPVHEAWIAKMGAELEQGDKGAYVNFLGFDGADRIRAAYPGKTWDRLRQIKRRYDPTNLFRLNQNIPPANVSV
ncbi:MAG TPA: FAD-binding oxidoreductase [Candidatus Limnocylindria bacterium]|nr:FAD-binding oxidoreductase [Candidatus Limnocylindria bacterium]